MEQGSSLPRSNCLRRHALRAIVSAVILALAQDLAAQTHIHRCTTSSGEIEFRQHPCADGSVGQELTIEDRKSGWVPPKGQSAGETKRTQKRRRPKAASRSDTAKARREEQCWKKRQLLEEVNWKLRRGYKAGKGAALRRKRRAYEDYITRYCG